MNLRKVDDGSRKNKTNKNVSCEACETQESMEQSDNSASFMQTRTAEQKLQYEQFIREVLTLGVDGLVREYNQQLKPYVAKEWKREISDKNLAKHRYKLLVCNDLTRVIIADGGQSDYIHANHVKINTCNNEFVCTQGPIVDTRHDFWRMVVHLRAIHIVMLCNVIEDERNKCDQYWPINQDESMQFGDITIRNIKVVELERDIIKTNLEITKGKEKYMVRHLHWRDWPDKNIPYSSLAALRILSSIRNSTTPIVIHCSAGIGRTGTIVAIELCIQKLLSTGTLNILEMCKKLRGSGNSVTKQIDGGGFRLRWSGPFNYSSWDCRIRAVEVELQYIYIAKTIIEYGIAMEYCVSREIKEEYAKFKKNLNSLAKIRSIESIAMQVAQVKADVNKVLGPIVQTENTNLKVNDRPKYPAQSATVIRRSSSAPVAPPNVKSQKSLRSIVDKGRIM